MEIKAKDIVVKVEINNEDFFHIDHIIRNRIGISIEEVLSAAIMREIDKIKDFVLISEKTEESVQRPSSD